MSQSMLSVNTEKGGGATSAGTRTRVVNPFFGVDDPSASSSVSPTPASPRCTTPVEGEAVNDPNEPYEFILDEPSRTVYWLQRHDAERSAPSSPTNKSSPSSSALYHSVVNPAAGYVAFQRVTATGSGGGSESPSAFGSHQQTTSGSLRSQPSFRRAKPRQSQERQNFLALCDHYSTVGALRPVAMLLSSAPSPSSTATGEEKGLRKTKSTMKSGVNLKRGAAEGGDGEGSSTQGLKLRILTEDSDIDEDVAALEDITPPVTVKMLEALTRCVLFSSQIAPLKMKPAQRTVQLKLSAPGAEEDSKAKYSFLVSPAHFQFPDFKPCVFRRRLGPAHPFARFTMSADMLFKTGFLLMEIRSDTGGFDPECDVVRMSDIGLNTTLRQGTKLVTVFKDLPVGTLTPIDVRKVTLPDGSTEERPRGFVLQFDSTSRATSNIIQIFVRSFSYNNLSPKPNAKRRVCVTLCDGGLFEATSSDVEIDVDHDDDTVPFEFGLSEGFAVHLEKEGPTSVFSDLSVQPQSSQMRLKLVAPSFLSVEGLPGDILRLGIPWKHQQHHNNHHYHHQHGEGTPQKFDIDGACDESSINELAEEEKQLPEQQSTDLALDEATGAIYIGQQRVGTLVAHTTTEKERPPATPLQAAPPHAGGRHRGTTVGFLDAEHASGADANLPSPSKSNAPQEQSAASVSPGAASLEHQRGSIVSALKKSTSAVTTAVALSGRRPRASVMPDLSASLNTSSNLGNPANAGAASTAGGSAAPTTRPPHSLRVEFEKFPLVHLQALLNALQYVYDAQQAAAAAGLEASTGPGKPLTQRGSKISLRDSEKGLVAATRSLNVTLGGSAACGLTPAGQPLLHIQPTVDVCAAQRLFYFNGKASTGSSSAALSSSSSMPNPLASSISSALARNPSLASIGDTASASGNYASEGLPWCIQGIDNELLPYMQINCWTSKFTIEIIESQGLSMSLRNSPKSTTIFTTSGLVADEAARPVAAVEFEGTRSMTLLPLPGSNRISADVAQRLLRNVLLSDALPADTNAVVTLTLETAGATRQEETVRCTSRKQNLAPSSLRRQSKVAGLSTARSFSGKTQNAEASQGSASASQ